ncbi:hypothetical protein F444_18416 [Phytophthora nicotianae P1976]|uniref:Uncharacterized protein n=1 Tax=Phytophthora nicotianae P1976 TaxID=1317066 RepID=A0A080ZBE4_PHYNI|nr:hypothetical protein F444_18416 [Phytophthora nicotianae P1976]
MSGSDSPRSPQGTPPTRRLLRSGSVHNSTTTSTSDVMAPARDLLPEALKTSVDLSRALEAQSVPNRSWSASNVLRNAPPLSSRYEDELTEPGVISNDLDGAQCRQIAAESHARPNRPVARPIVGSSPRLRVCTNKPGWNSRRAFLQLLDTYTCGPSERTTDEVVRRQTLRERYLTPQVTTPAEYHERLRQQLNGEPVPSMQTVHVVLAEGETTGALEAQFQKWVELARRLHSYDALRASFSETDIRLERRLRFDFAKSQAKRPTGQSLNLAIDLSSPHSSSGKRVAPADSVVRPTGGSSPSDPDHKRQQRQGSPAAVAPRTPTSSVNEGNLATSQCTGCAPGVDAAPSGAPHGSGTPLARRAEHDDDEQPLDSRAASFVEFLYGATFAR